MTKLTKNFRFQIGTVVILILIALIIPLVVMHVVSGRYDREVFVSKQEKLAFVSRGLSRDLAKYMQKTDNPRELQNYFESRIQDLHETNEYFFIGFYLPEYNQNRFYGKWTEENRFLLSKLQSDLAESGEFAEVKLNTVTAAKNIFDDRKRGIFLGRIEPVIIEGNYRAAVLIAEFDQGGLMVVRQIRNIIVLIVPPLFLVGSIAAFVVLARLKKGVSQILTGLASLETDRAYRLSAQSSTELNEIVAGINQMADAVQHQDILEEELERSARLASLGRLVAGVAHEIRNPLGIMKATVQVMQDEFKQQDEVKEYLTVLIDQIDRQNKSIQELLAYAKPVPPIFQPIQVNDLLESVITIAKSYFQQQRVTVQPNFHPQVPVVQGDAEKLKQAFLNLVLNAVEAMGPEGRLAISTGLTGEQVFIDIADNGVGIPKEDLDKLFEPFYTTKHAGTGLGLAMVHKTIELHQGSIEVNSDVNTGTVFRILLPTGKLQGVLS